MTAPAYVNCEACGRLLAVDTDGRARHVGVTDAAACDSPRPAPLVLDLDAVRVTFGGVGGEQIDGARVVAVGIDGAALSVAIQFDERPAWLASVMAAEASLMSFGPRRPPRLAEDDNPRAEFARLMLAGWPAGSGDYDYDDERNRLADQD